METRHARIFQPAKQSTSSGRYKTRSWVLEAEPRIRPEADRLMGWVGLADMDQQVRLPFPTREAAVAYCERNGLTYTLSEPMQQVVKPKSYAENFIKKT